MIVKNSCLRRATLAALASMGLAFVSAPQAKAVTTYYFDTNGATAGMGLTDGSTYSWDDPNWSTDSTGSSATIPWPGGQFPKFTGGVAGQTYTVNVGQDESIAGMFDASAGSIVINQTPSTSGQLDLVSGLQGILGGGSGSTLVINAPIVGSGGVEPEQSSSTFYFNGNNTYTGGTTFFYSSALTYFNNGSAFGTGSITVGISSATSYAPILCTAGASTTMANNWNMTKGGINFASNANTPINATGSWTLGTANPNLIRNNGDATSPLTLSGQITGAGNVVFSGANSSTITLSGTTNNYTGTTTIGVSGDTAIALNLAAMNAIGTTTGVILAGGTLDPDGLNQAMSSAPLTLSANSTVTYSAGGAEVDFADSHSTTWSGTLDITSWDPTLDKMRFGTSSGGLTSGQLADIEINNNAGTKGEAFLDANGYLVVPEPASIGLLLLGAPMLAARRRRG